MTIWFSNKMMIYGIGKEISMCSGSEERLESCKLKTGKVEEAGSINNSFDWSEHQHGSQVQNYCYIILQASKLDH